MSPIPSEPLEPQPHELTTKDGKRYKLKIPGLEPPAEPEGTEERGATEPPRDDPRTPLNPYTTGF